MKLLHKGMVDFIERLNFGKEPKSIRSAGKIFQRLKSLMTRCVWCGGCYVCDRSGLC